MVLRLHIPYKIATFDALFYTLQVSVDNFGALQQIPLIPNGGNIPVTQSNKQQYVEQYIHYRFTKSCRATFEAFKEGFFNVCSGYVIKMFRPSELQVSRRFTATFMIPISYDLLDFGGKYTAERGYSVS